MTGVRVPVSGDHQSPLSPDDAHAALAELVASWGLGGALAELQHLSARHGGLPAEAEQVLAPLSMLVGTYATTGSTSAGAAWRSAPCLLCAAEVAL